MTTALLENTTRTALWSGSVIDADVHANVPSLETLQKYQERVWVQWAQERGWAGPSGLKIAYPPNAPTTSRMLGYVFVERNSPGCPSPIGSHAAAGSS